MDSVQNDKSATAEKKSFFERFESRRETLRRLGWAGVAVFLVGNGLATLRFFFPRVLFEPPSRFKIGRPSEYSLGSVSTRYKAKYRIWVIRKDDGEFFCLQAKCTHRGCTPIWMSVQKKFKCPCHGSGFYSSGDNFEGPAPRPLDRFKITLADDGQLVVDKGVVFKGMAGKDSDQVYPQSLLEV